MNTTEVLHKSLAWISGREFENKLRNYEVSGVLNSLDTAFFSQFARLEVSEGGEIRSYYSYGQGADIVVDADVTQVAPEEVYFLTQVILNTLNTEPDRFHDMFDIPGLEMEGWEQLGNVAQYLINQGWIEPKATEEKLLVKLTIEGKIYLRNTNAWS